MHLNTKIIALAGLLCATSSAQQTQFNIGGRTVQFHGFLQQGYAYTGGNNYLTMKTGKGAFDFTDGALNVSMRITNRFRVGAQAYSRNIGRLGNGHVQFDWAFGDYRFADWFGVRAGKVKTVLGLYNDTQDAEFLHTWAILPQSMYPLDLRASTIAHTGGDFYGDIALKRLGSLAYTAYMGSRAGDKNGGFRYVVLDSGNELTSETGSMRGADLRWTTPVKGLLLGASYLNVRGSTKGLTFDPFAIPLTHILNVPMSTTTVKDNTTGFYADYMLGSLHVSGEYRRWWNVTNIDIPFFVPLKLDTRSWYASAAYRVSMRLELGTYYSRFYSDWRVDRDSPNNQIFDRVATARIDLTRHWNLKIEGHSMRGHGSYQAVRGFYFRDNPAGLRPNTNLLVIRTGFSL
jgi:hypothetical protein